MIHLGIAAERTRLRLTERDMQEADCSDEMDVTHASSADKTFRKEETDLSGKCVCLREWSV